MITAARLEAARAFLAAAAPALSGPFAAITREAGRLNLPKHYRRDLTRWDRRSLMHAGAGTRFAWCVRENGTHLLFPDPNPTKGNDPAQLARTIASLFEPAAWFWYDGKGSRGGIHWIGNGREGAEKAAERLRAEADRMRRAVRP